MNDCPKAELRDRLPDLLHERLDAFARAAVVSHLDECVLCREELELLRGLRGMMVTQGRAVVPRIDVAAIVRTLPAPSVQRPAATRRPNRFSDWRIAAAITMLLAAGTSVGAYLRTGDVVPTDSAIGRLRLAVDDSGVGSQTPVQFALAPSELYVGGGLADLSEDDLQTLASDIAQFDALPPSDPEVGLPVPLAAPEGL